MVLEAVSGTSPTQQWDLSSSFSPSKSQSTQSSAHGSISRSSESTSFPVANLYAEAVDVVSLSDSAPTASSATTGSASSPETLPPIHTAVEEEAYNYDDGDNMSEDSSGTAVIVGHPCSDEEEDSAERRWRRAEQRGNDIRRARAPPCPKAVGTECFLKAIVVSSLYHSPVLSICASFAPQMYVHIQALVICECAGPHRRLLLSSCLLRTLCVAPR